MMYSLSLNNRLKIEDLDHGYSRDDAGLEKMIHSSNVALAQLGMYTEFLLYRHNKNDATRKVWRSKGLRIISSLLEEIEDGYCTESAVPFRYLRKYVYS